MKICKRCVLPDSFPGIRFDEKGVCQFCLKFTGKEILDPKKQETRTKFEEILKQIRGKNAYDCLLALSGGKDSTYTLGILKDVYDLKVLAFTFDNWFQSETSAQNIKKTVRYYNVDHQILRPAFETLRKIFVAASENNIFSSKSIERASTICTACLSIIRFSCLRLAVEKNIPLVIMGMSPGQAGIKTAIYKSNPAMLEEMQKLVYQPLFDIAGDAIIPYFLEKTHFEQQSEFPYLVNVLSFLEYDEDSILKNIQKTGWESPQDVDANSTNCVLNAFANHIHETLHGFHPYVFELAKLVREGNLDREAALLKLNEKENLEALNLIKKRLGYRSLIYGLS